MSGAVKRRVRRDLAEGDWHILAYAYKKAPSKVCFSDVQSETNSPSPNLLAIDILARDGLITGEQDEFTITEKGKALYEREYFYYQWTYPTVKTGGLAIVPRIIATIHYWLFRIQAHPPFVDSAKKAWSDRRQRIQRKVRCTQVQCEIMQAAASASEFEDCLHRMAALIQEYLGINVVAIFIADPPTEWSVFRAGVAKEPKGEEGIRILKERGHKIYLRDEISLIDYRTASLYKSESLLLLARPRSISRFHPITRRHLYQSPLFGHTGSVILIPLQTAQNVIGTLELDTFYTQASFGQDELSALLPLADQVAHICESHMNTDQQSKEQPVPPRL